MMSSIKWLLLTVAFVLIGVLISQRLIDFSQHGVPLCSTVADMQFSRCMQRAELAVSQGNTYITAIGIAVAIISTIALIVTIALTAQATAAATKAVELASEEIRHTQFVAGLELRPYIMFHDIFKSYALGQDNSVSGWQIRFIMKNVGHTPARFVTTKSHWQVFEGTPPDDFTFPWAGDIDEFSLIGPDGTTTSNTEVIPSAVIDRVVKQEVRMFVWNWTEYQGFAPGERYRTESHFEISLFSGNSQSKAELSHSAILRARHNAMDDGCTRPLVTRYR